MRRGRRRRRCRHHHLAAERAFGKIFSNGCYVAAKEGEVWVGGHGGDGVRVGRAESDSEERYVVAPVLRACFQDGRLCDGLRIACPIVTDGVRTRVGAGVTPTIVHGPRAHRTGAGAHTCLLAICQQQHDALWRGSRDGVSSGVTVHEQLSPQRHSVGDGRPPIRPLTLTQRPDPVVFTDRLSCIHPIREGSAAVCVILTQLEPGVEHCRVMREHGHDIARGTVEVYHAKLRGTLPKFKTTNDFPCEVVHLIVRHLAVLVAVHLVTRATPEAVLD